MQGVTTYTATVQANPAVEVLGAAPKSRQTVMLRPWAQVGRVRARSGRSHQAQSLEDNSRDRCAASGYCHYSYLGVQRLEGLGSRCGLPWGSSSNEIPQFIRMRQLARTDPSPTPEARGAQETSP